ncbi:hypothetical protein NMG60_11018578 [Bertholletia excelsa]
MMAEAASVSAATEVSASPLYSYEHKRDAYGFAIRPEHVQSYREYASIYKEEEDERSVRWKDFLERQAKSAELQIYRLSSEEDKMASRVEIAKQETQWTSERGAEEADLRSKMSGSLGSSEDVKEETMPAAMEMKTQTDGLWSDINPSLYSIENMNNIWVKKKSFLLQYKQSTGAEEPLPPAEEGKFTEIIEEGLEEFFDEERSDSTQGGSADAVHPTSLYLWKEELESLVHGGVPMALRGEVWQTFVGVRARRVEKYYHDLLGAEFNFINSIEKQSLQLDLRSKGSNTEFAYVPERWLAQIEKDLPRTFPGHPALDEDGRNALRRLLIAYARHNPSVGYCQAMNFFAGLLLLLMPEENAFWTLTGLLDDYFDGYYSEEMTESQVDQLVFEELVREIFPKLVNHLDYLEVQLEWVTGPWFLSIFMNMLPWESVLRVWDVLLFEGNRVMLFRTALALMKLYGPALMTTNDGGDAVTLLQSLTSSTFDSSQLVMTACMGFQNVNETRLRELRNKHRPAITAVLEERSRGLLAWRGSEESGPVEEVLMDLAGDGETDYVDYLQEQVMLLKVQFFKLLEEKRIAVLRAKELEMALMEIVKQDNRQQLRATVEQLGQEVALLHKALADKQTQENAMLQVLLRAEQEQRVTEDARRYAEQEAAAWRQAAQVLQEKYNKVTATIAAKEKRAAMTESMLEATLQYQSVQVKAQPSPRSVQLNSSPVQSVPMRKISLLPLRLGWRDSNKGKP